MSALDEPSGSPAHEGAPPEAPDEEGAAPAEAPLLEDGPALQESPERAGRRAAKGGRVGTRLAAMALLAALLPCALASAALFLLVEPQVTAPRGPTLSMADIRAAQAELQEAERALTLVARDERNDAAAGDLAEARLSHARAVLARASLAVPLPDDGYGPAGNAAELARLRVMAAAAALLLAFLLGGGLALRLRRQLAAPLTALEARLRLLAGGHAAPRAALRRPGELEDAEDAVDAVERALAALDAGREREHARSRRLYALAEVIDAAARGRLDQRAPPSDDVAEATLASALDRLLDSVERQVVRLKSHLDALTRAPPPAGDDDEDPGEGVARRVQGLRPVPPLLLEISGRLVTLAKGAPEGSKLAADLAKLSEAISQRGRAALALLDALEGDLARLPSGGAGGEGLTGAQRRALEQLTDDLRDLATDGSLCSVVQSLPELDAGELAARLAPPPESA